MTKMLFIGDDPPCGTERSDNGLRPLEELTSRAQRADRALVF